MKREELGELTSKLSKERSMFRYFRDYYALYLLELISRGDVALDRIRSSSFGRLLNKPATRPLLALCGDGKITPERIGWQWQEPSVPFLMTVGSWCGDSRWNQTSRKGYNLVLRLNFTADHDRKFRQLLKVDQDSFFNGWGHPVMQRRERSYFRETLAWARLDIDLERGEVLIEEVQSDWVRAVNALKSCMNRCGREAGSFRYRGLAMDIQLVKAYVDKVFSPYAEIWDQAMLCAVIRFCVEEIDIRSFWYHTWETGAEIKRIGLEYGPPRSLYSDLPRRFCFQEREAMPEMLKRRDIERRLNRSKVQPRFFRLELG